MLVDACMRSHKVCVCVSSESEQDCLHHGLLALPQVGGEESARLSSQVVSLSANL